MLIGVFLSSLGQPAGDIDDDLLGIIGAWTRVLVCQWGILPVRGDGYGF
jgi:hypothetical protein